MKKYLRQFVVNAFSLNIATNILQGVVLQQKFGIIFQAALALTAVNIFVKPLIKFLLLPINLLTLGLLRWVVNVFALYLVTLIIPAFQITAFTFSATTIGGIIIPEIYISQLAVYILCSFIVSLTTTFLLWLAK